MKKIVFLSLLFIVLLQVKAQLRVCSLRVEHCVNPDVVDVLQPRLSWVNEPKDERVKGQRQTACRIVVSSSEERLRKGDYDLWDSGRVPVGSTATVCLPTDTIRVQQGRYLFKVNDEK